MTLPIPWSPGAAERHRVAVLGLHSVVAFELGLPHRFLSNQALLPDDADPGAEPPYDTQLITVDNQPVTTSAGYRATPTADNSLIAMADTVVIPGITDHPTSRDGTLPDDLRRVLDAARPDVRWVSICTGAFVLAAFGLLDGRPATTHWMHTDRFARAFPAVHLDPTVLFVDNGDVLTSAGNAAGIDLLLHLVRRDHGSATANRVARGAVVAPWRDGGQAQFIEAPLPRDSAGSSTAATRQWVLERLADGVDLAAMAGHARMSVRTFTRRFRDETGETAGSWLTRARTDRARHLLEATDLPIDQVAEQAGFGTTASLRQQLSASIGLSPSSYRRRFRADAAERFNSAG